MNYKSTGAWDETAITNHQAIIAIATALQKKSRNGSDHGKKPGQPAGGASQKLPAWRISNTGPTYTAGDGTTWMWCHVKTNGQRQGLYIPSDHNHESWAANKLQKAAAWKEKLAARKAAKHDAPKEPKDNDSKKKSKSGKQKLGLAKSFKTALTTKSQMGDHEANDLVDTVMGAFPNDSESSDNDSD